MVLLVLFFPYLLLSIEIDVLGKENMVQQKGNLACTEIIVNIFSFCVWM